MTLCSDISLVAGLAANAALVTYKSRISRVGTGPFEAGDLHFSRLARSDAPPSDPRVRPLTTINPKHIQNIISTTFANICTHSSALWHSVRLLSTRFVFLLPSHINQSYLTAPLEQPPATPTKPSRRWTPPQPWPHRNCSPSRARTSS